MSGSWENSWELTTLPSGARCASCFEWQERIQHHLNSHCLKCSHRNGQLQLRNPMLVVSWIHLSFGCCCWGSVSTLCYDLFIVWVIHCVVGVRWWCVLFVDGFIDWKWLRDRSKPCQHIIGAQQRLWVWAIACELRRTKCCKACLKQSILTAPTNGQSDLD
jgi:hypothetical protein